jgi:hypothetical protein
MLYKENYLTEWQITEKNGNCRLRSFGFCASRQVYFFSYSNIILNPGINRSYSKFQQSG